MNSDLEIYSYALYLKCKFQKQYFNELTIPVRVQITNSIDEFRNNEPAHLDRTSILWVQGVLYVGVVAVLYIFEISYH